jgi:hypothetical protein
VDVSANVVAAVGVIKMLSRSSRGTGAELRGMTERKGREQAGPGVSSKEKSLSSEKKPGGTKLAIDKDVISFFYERDGWRVKNFTYQIGFMKSIEFRSLHRRGNFEPTDRDCALS